MHDLSDAPRQTDGDLDSDAGFDEVAAALRPHALEYLQGLFPNGKLIGREFQVGDFDDTPGDSLQVNIDKGVGTDFAAGEKIGDLIALTAARLRVAPLEAKRYIETWLADKPVTPQPSAVPDDTDPLWYLYMPAGSAKIWSYVDAEGVEVYQIKRWTHPRSGKKAVRPWDPAAGRYAMPTNLERRPLLYLPKITASTGPVVVLEGERCADAVASLGYVATTVTGGNKAVRSTDLSPLEDRDVVLWRDNDKAGLEWEKAMMEALRTVGARAVQSVELPSDAPPKWDAADAPEDQRANLLRATLSSGAIYLQPRPCRVRDMLPGEETEVDWITAGGIPRGQVTTIQGPSGVGKGFTMIDLCLKVGARHTMANTDRSASTFLGEIPATAAGCALFISLEDSKAVVHRRLSNIDEKGEPKGIDPSGELRRKSRFSILTGPDLPDFDFTLMTHDGRVKEFTRFATKGLDLLMDDTEKDYGAPMALLVLDPGPEMLEGDENTSKAVRPFISFLEKMAARRNCAIALIGHGTKNQAPGEGATTMRGSGMWFTKPRFSYGIRRLSSNRADAGKIDAFLKALGKEKTPRTVRRIAVAETVKSTNGTLLEGLRYLYQDEDTGVLKDHTFIVNARLNSPERASQKDLLVEAIRRAAAIGIPFTKTGADGLSEGRKMHLPAQLQGLERDELKDMVKELHDEKRITLVSNSVVGRHRLDVPDGELANENVEKNRGGWPTDIYDDLYKEEYSESGKNIR